MIFEVFIPCEDLTGFDVTLRVEAENWMQALKLGLERAGESARTVRNMLCDLQENHLVEVKDLARRRTYRIRQLSDEEMAGQRVEPGTPSRGQLANRPPALEPGRKQEIPVRVPEAKPTAPKPAVNTLTMPTGSPLGVVAQTGVFRQIGAHDTAAATPQAEGRLLRETVSPTRERMEALKLQEAPPPRLTESAIEDVFLEIPDLFQEERTLESAVEFCLDLAMRHIDAESGSVLFADQTGRTLYFAAVRGPVKDAIVEHDYEIPVTQGIAGFCTRRGVSLNISEPRDDPRFFGGIARELDYPTRSILCAPVECEGRCFGAIELLNRRPGGAFTDGDANILSYIGAQVGRFIANLLS